MFGLNKFIDIFMLHLFYRYFTRLGINCKNTEVVVYACVFEGRKYVFSNTGQVSYEKKVCFSINY